MYANAKQRKVEERNAKKGENPSPAFFKYVAAVGILIPVLVFTFVGAYVMIKSVDNGDPDEPRRIKRQSQEKECELFEDKNAQESSCKSAPKEVAKVAKRAVCQIESDEGRGSGVIVRDDGRLYLYTCEHVTHSVREIRAKFPNGQVIKLGNFEVSANRDLVRFEISGSADVVAFDVGTSLPAERKCVYAFGNTSGAGVITEEKGEILAVGAERIEVSCNVMQGNSGGPVVDAKGLLVGIVSGGVLQNDEHSKGTRYEKVRRFAERVDSVEWLPMDFDEYFKQSSLFYDAITMFCEIDILYDKMGRDRVMVCRPCDASRKYRYWSGMSDVVERAYENINAGINQIDKLAQLDKEYSDLRLEFKDDYLNLQTWKIETFSWIEKRAMCVRQELDYFQRGGVDEFLSCMQEIKQVMLESELRIPSFGCKAKELTRRIEVDWPERFKNVSALYAKSRDDIDRYERTAKESAEADYQRLLKVHMATKEILKWRERELRKERERQENAQREWQRVLRR